MPAVENETYPLLVRNRNVFTVPYDDAADAVIAEVFGDSGRVRLSTAATTLRVANATLDERNNATGTERRDALREEVAAANAHVADRVAMTLVDEGVGNNHADGRTVVRRGLRRWNTTASRGSALANGSAVPAIADAAAARTGANETRRDWLRLRIDETRREALREKGGRPSSEIVGKSRNVTRQVASELATEAGTAVANRTATRAYERAVNETFDSLPSGLPLAPVPGHWYATANVWRVTVRGEYARFGVRASRGRPTAPGGELAYARDGDAVTVDFDGDGEAERLGRASRVDFDVSTTVVVVVPPGKGGVGDVDGNADERSPGWSGGE